MSILEGMQVLIVEDEYLVSITTEEYLNDLGCDAVHTAFRLEEAMEQVQTLPLDLALLDVNLAGKLSYPVAEILKSRGIPFLFLTGYGLAGLPESLRNAAVLSKPFDEESLVKALRTVLGKPQVNS